jgi:hypothetical protein
MMVLNICQWVLQNTVPKVETNSNSCWLFSREAESVTYAGDKLKYDDNIIYDENSNQIGTRNGFILSRENLDGSISKIGENKNIEDIN